MAKVLLIEDNDLLRELMTSMLTDLGNHEARVAASGEAGLKILQSESCDVVVTEILMDGMDGLEFLRVVREAGIDVPIIAVSGGGQISAGDYLKVTRTLGVRHTLTKPFDANVLLDAITECITSPRQG